MNEKCTENDAMADDIAFDPMYSYVIIDVNSPRIGNGLVWTVSFVDGNILCDAVGDIALELDGRM